MIDFVIFYCIFMDQMGTKAKVWLDQMVPARRQFSLFSSLDSEKIKSRSQ